MSGMRRLLLGLPVFETIIATVIYTALLMALLLPVVAWIRALFK
jgi:hypothetical protein